jgi:hypothetical protein
LRDVDSENKFTGYLRKKAFVKTEFNLNSVINNYENAFLNQKVLLEFNTRMVSYVEESKLAKLNELVVYEVIDKSVKPPLETNIFFSLKNITKDV